MVVVPFKTFTTECVDDLIELLEHNLVRAKNGEFQCGAMIFVRPDGSVKCEFSKSENTHAIVAGCSYLLHDIIGKNY